MAIHCDCCPWTNLQKDKLTNCTNRTIKQNSQTTLIEQILTLRPWTQQTGEKSSLCTLFSELSLLAWVFHPKQADIFLQHWESCDNHCMVAGVLTEKKEQLFLLHCIGVLMPQYPTSKKNYPIRNILLDSINASIYTPTGESVFYI